MSDESQAAPRPTAAATPYSQTLTDAEVKALLQNYFSGRHDQDVAARRALDRSSLVARIAFAVIGLVMVLWPMAMAALPMTVEAFRGLGSRPNLALIVAGAVLVVIAVYRPVWSRGWPRPTALALLTAMADLHFVSLVHPFVVYAIGLLAAGLLGWDIVQWVRGYRAPAETADLEVQIDRWIGNQIQSLIATSRSELPVPEDRFAGHVILTCFPKLDRVAPDRIRARIGTDKKPRVSPVGLAMFDFGEETVVMFEGAIDLWSQKIVYARLHQFRYGDIVALAWSSDAYPPGEKSVPPPTIVEKMRTFDDRRAVVRRKDELQIRLYGHRNVSVVLRDCGLHENLRNREFLAIEDISKVRDVWQRLSDGKRRARALPLV